MNKELLKSSKIFLKKTSYAFVLILLTFKFYGQDSLHIQDIEEVIVSASRTEQETKKVGRSISIITQEDIQKSLCSNVSELLAIQEGIHIIGQNQNPGSVQNIYMRGTGSNQTLVLIDGIRVTDPSSVDNSINLTELSPANIERIEIVRGTHSTMFGSSATGGIINIITKKTKSKGIHALADLIAGTFGNSTRDLTQNVYLNYTSHIGLYAAGELYHSSVRGLDATIDTITNPNTFKTNDKDDFLHTDVIGKIGYINNKLDLSISYKNTNQDIDIDDSAFTDDDNHKVNFKRISTLWQAAYKPADRLNIKIVGGYNTMKRAVEDDSSLVDEFNTYDHAFSRDRYYGRTMNNEFQINYRAEDLSLLAGIGNYEEKMSSDSYYTNTAWAYTFEENLDSLDIRSTINTAFIHMIFNGGLFFEKLNFFQLSSGLRINDHNAFGLNYTYDLNPSFALSEHSMIYFSFSKGFNAPSLYRLYSPQKNTISGISRGNSALDSENSSSYEVGIKQSNDKFEFNISVFRTEIDNLIEYVYLWDKNIGIDTLGNDWIRDDYRGDTYINIGKQVNKGFEISLRSNLSDKVSVAGNISLVNGSLSYSPKKNNFSENFHIQLFSTGDFLNKDIELNGLTRRSNTANLFLNYKPIKKLYLSTDIKYVGDRTDIFYDPTLGPYGALGKTEVNDYTLFGFTAKYHVLKNLSVTMRINNILNKEYQEIIGYNTKGRGIYLKLSFEI